MTGKHTSLVQVEAFATSRGEQHHTVDYVATSKTPFEREIMECAQRVVLARALPFEKLRTKTGSRCLQMEVK